VRVLLGQDVGLQIHCWSLAFQIGCRCIRAGILRQPARRSNRDLRLTI
jgi:hypothetical protein